jgi:hypothetical protein
MGAQSPELFTKMTGQNTKVLVCLVFVTSLLTFVNGCTISNISHTSEFLNSIYLHWDLTQDCSGSAFFSKLNYSNKTKTKIKILNLMSDLQTLSKYIKFSKHKRERAFNCNKYYESETSEHSDNIT